MTEFFDYYYDYDDSFDYYGEDDDYSDLSVSYEEHEPVATKQETVFLNGFLYDVIVTVDSDLSIHIVHRPVEYTCWDGELPF